MSSASVLETRERAMLATLTAGFKVASESQREYLFGYVEGIVSTRREREQEEKKEK